MSGLTSAPPPTGPSVGIDFGASNTDIVLRGDHGDDWRRWTLPSIGTPSESRVREVLEAGDIRPRDVAWMAITGGDRQALPATIDARPIRSVNEMHAIGMGGLALSGLSRAIVTSAGSGTAVVRAEGTTARHVTGTGVGGGTLVGLGRLLLNTVNPREIDALASRGHASGVNLTIGEILGTAIGSLPADTTAVNFGRVARHPVEASREDLAAALVNMVGQVVGVIAINAARAEQMEHIVVVGHLTDLPSVRETLRQVGVFYGASIILPEFGGFATATGALLDGAALAG